MTVIAFVDLVVSLERDNDAPTVISEFLEATRSFDGCESVEVLADASDGSRYRVVATWRDEPSETAYREWRRGLGRSPAFGALLSEAPLLSRFVRTSI